LRYEMRVLRARLLFASFRAEQVTQIGDVPP
jgi:hypothetical protein